MKAINSAINRFCHKHPNFGIPRLIIYVVLATAVVAFFIGGTPLFFAPGRVMQGEVWRVITWIFIPPNMGGGFGGIFFAAIYLYFLYFMGSTLEREWGTAKFTIFYFLGVLLSIIYGLIIYFTSDALARVALDNRIWLSPTFLNLSMFFAFASIFPDFTLRLFLIIPLKAKWLALFNGGFFIFSMVSEFMAGNHFTAFLPLVAILNFFIMCSGDLFGYAKSFQTARSPAVINFKKATKKAKREMADMPYRHKCAVCGKTDVDHPNLEFRYCSQCEGYHCFCLEHINNHIHFI